MSSDMHDLLGRMADELDNYRQLLTDDRREVHALATEARAALAAVPEGEGPPAVTISALLHPAYEPGDGSADRAQMVGMQWWHPVMGCDSLQLVVGNARNILRSRWARPATPLKPVAYIHRQGKHWEVSERLLQDDERARGWTEEPLYAAPPAPLEGEVGEQPGSPEGEARALARAIDEVAKGWRPQAYLLGDVTAKQLRLAAALLRQYWLLLGRQHRLQEESHRFREPERTILCDILANGTLLPDPDGTRYGIPATTPAPLEGEVGELVAALRSASDGASAMGWERDSWVIARAATLLEQLYAAAPAVVPVPVSERLPGEDDCDAEGTCWVWNRTASTWGLFRFDLTAHSHWLPAHALPLPAPQDGEVKS